MELFSLIFAQSAPGGGGSGLGGLLPILIMFAAMYFLLIAPQRKKQKQHQKMISELTSGADVVTSGGIYGTITNVKDAQKSRLPKILSPASSPAKTPLLADEPCGFLRAQLRLFAPRLIVTINKL